MITKFLRRLPAPVLIGIDLLIIGGATFVATQTTGWLHWGAIIFSSLVAFFLGIGLVAAAVRHLSRP